MKKLFTLIAIIAIQLGYAQREANIWHFGDGVGLDFNSCEPVTAISQMSTSEGCTSIAESSSGELQFYTNGSTIWNRNHITMSNGSGLLGHRSATQSSMIIKRPGNFNEYYIFTVDEVGKTNGLMYSIVDMDGAGGLGTVTSKNIPLISPIVEKIHAVRHENGEDIWISVHGFENSNFYSFLVTSTGVNPVPVTSTVGPSISGAGVATIGAMKFSPNGRKLAICNYEHGVGLFDFDKTSGVFSNPVVVTPRLFSYGVEFSKSSNLLYVSISSAFLDINNKLLQYNLRAPIIQDSEVVLLDFSDSQGIGSLQLGPDHKLYVSIVGRKSLSVINEPNQLGVSCDFVEDAFDLGGRTAKAGLPLFLFPILHNKVVVEDTCFGDVTSFALSEDIGTVEWDFGDPASGVNNTASDNEPSHFYSAPGIYTVTTNIPAGCGPYSTITKQIEIFDIQTLPSVQLIQCDDNSDGFSFFNLNEAGSKLSSNNTGFIFYRTEDEAKRRINNIQSPNSYENVIPYSDSVWVSFGNSGGCYNVVEINLIVSENNIFDTFQSLVFNLCDDNVNDGVTIFDFSSAESTIEGLFTGQVVDITYFRNLEDALAETNKISNIGSYENIGYPYSQDIYVRVDDKLSNDCLGIGSLIVLTVKEQPQFELDSDAEICLSERTNLTLEAINPMGVYTYKWTDSNGNVISTDIAATVNLPDTYTLIATSNDDGCESYPREVNVTFIENVSITSEMITVEDSLENNTILIDEAQLGTGDYEYVLDDKFGVYQNEPFFNNITAGVHTIYVREKSNCEPNSIEISVIGFPKFFTPNNDSQNDRWNIKGLGNDYLSSSKVSIYNRYGKLIKQISPKSDGWDGTFNGQNLSQSDFWFIAKLVHQERGVRILRGHFSLVR